MDYEFKAPKFCGICGWVDKHDAVKCSDCGSDDLVEIDASDILRSARAQVAYLRDHLPPHKQNANIALVQWQLRIVDKWIDAANSALRGEEE